MASLSFGRTKLRLLSTFMLALGLVVQPFSVLQTSTAYAAPVVVTTQTELKDALADSNVSEITLGANIDTTEKLLLSRSNVTIDGDEYRLRFDTDAAGWQGNYVLHVYNATDVTIKNIELNEGDAGLLVNGSEVTLAGNITLDNNEFGGIEVAKGTAPGLSNSALTVEATITNPIETSALPTIWLINGQGTVNAGGMYESPAKAPGKTYYYLNEANAGAVNVNNSLYFDTIQQAVDAATAYDVVNAATGTYAEDVIITEPLTLNGAQAGVDARDRSGSETTLSSVTVTASDVAIDGFSFNNPGNQINVAPSPATGLTLSGLVFQNNIFSGYTSVGLTTNNAGNLLVQNNLFRDVSGSGESMQIRANGISDNGGCSDTQVLNNDFVNASNNNSADVNFSCTGSGSTDVTVAGNTTTGSTASFTAYSGVAGGIDVHGNTATGVQDSSAIFFFGNVTGDVNIYENIITGGDSSAVSISSGIYDGSGPNTGTFTIENNDFSNNVNGISVSAGAFGTNGNLVAHGNDLAGNTGKGVVNGTNTLIDASANWWGDNGPFGQYTGDVTVAPWCFGDDCTSLQSNEPLALPVNSGAAEVVVDTILDNSSATDNVRAVLPGGTTVTASDPSWGGTINAPTVSSYTVPGAASTGIAITVGSNDYTLTFNHAVQLYFPGQGDKSVGFKTPAGNFTEITATCVANDPTAVDGQLVAPLNDCKMTIGSDLVVWTKHFTTFATYTPPPSTSQSSSTSTSSTSTRRASNFFGTTTYDDSWMEGANTEAGETFGEVLSGGAAVSGTSTTDGETQAVLANGISWYWWLLGGVLAAGAWSLVSLLRSGRFNR